MTRAALLALAALVAANEATAEAAAPRVSERLLREQWPAYWIAAREGPERDAGVFHFRRRLKLAARPGRFVVHVSADNRYLLHVNGRRVGAGPARSDVLHWSYETYELAPYLEAGDNLVAATVWNFGSLAPMAQMSRRTGFLMQGDDEAASQLDTNRSWEAALDPGHAPNADGVAALRARRFYYAAGPGERRDASRWDWLWDDPGSPAERWKPARELNHGHPNTIREGPGWLQSPEGWLLEPSPLPAMEHRPVPEGRLARATGIDAGAFPQAALRGGGILCKGLGVETIRDHQLSERAELTRRRTCARASSPGTSETSPDSSWATRRRTSTIWARWTSGGMSRTNRSTSRSANSSRSATVSFSVFSLIFARKSS